MKKMFQFIIFWSVKQFLILHTLILDYCDIKIFKNTRFLRTDHYISRVAIGCSNVLHDNRLSYLGF